MKVIALLPARLKSKRIKRKCLQKLNGIPLIIHTLNRVNMIKSLSSFFVCTDSEKIKSLVERYGFKAFLTSARHKNGTERIAEISKKMKADLFVDIHSDEVLLEPKTVERLIKFHKKNMRFDIVVPNKKSKIDGGKNIVKLIVNKYNDVVYFTRSSCPFGFRKKNERYLHHVDTISFKPKTLLKFSKLKIGYLENVEGVELLRAIENKISIGTFSINSVSFSINTPKDFYKAEQILEKDKLYKKYFEKISK